MPTNSLNAPCIRISGPYLGSEEEVMRRTDLMNKTKWLGAKNFATTGQKSCLSQQQKNYITNYVSMTPSRPALLHQFRELDKTKFIDKNHAFRLC